MHAIQHQNKDAVQENTSTKTDDEQECYGNDTEATNRRKTPETSHSGEKEVFKPTDYHNSFDMIVLNTWD